MLPLKLSLKQRARRPSHALRCAPLLYAPLLCAHLASCERALPVAQTPPPEPADAAPPPEPADAAPGSDPEPPPQTCALPPTYRELRFAPSLVVLSRGVIDASLNIPSGSAREAQLIASFGSTGRVARSAAEAISETDDDSFDLITLFDVGTRRAFDVVTATYGDNRYGRVFEANTAEVVATITDSDLSGCAVARGLEGTPCVADDLCAPGVCLGVVYEEVCEGGVCAPTSRVLGEGRCARTWAPELSPSRGSACADDAPCPLSEGLSCAPLGDEPGSAGLCEEAWLRRRFSFEGVEGSLQSARTVIPLVVSGVATVSLRTTLSAVISHPRPADLTVSLQHPGGGSTAVVFSDPGATGEVVLRDVRALLPADESVNGAWSLIIEDAGGGDPNAFIFAIELEVSSWFD